MVFLGMTLLFAGCTQLKLAESPLTGPPNRFDATPPPVPEITKSLASLFQDKTLTRYLARAQSHNPNLQIAAANLREAGFNTRISKAALLPNISANSNGSRSQANSAGQGFNAGTFDATRLSASLDVNWEVDIWGRVRADIIASQRDQLALAADYKTVQQSIAAQTTQAYFQLIAATQRLELATRRVESFALTANTLQRRFDQGTESLQNLSLAKTDVSNAKATLADTTNLRDQASRLLASLIGAYPDRSRQAYTWPTLKRRVATGIPSSLLRRRPDLDAAYQRIRAADARITIAQANLLPTFALTGSYGRQSDKLRDLLSSDFTVWSIAGNFVAPLFNSGALRAEINAANERAKSAVANYYATTLTALREVEDALGSESFLAQREESTTNALSSAQLAQTRAKRTFESGTADIITLLEAQRRAYDTEEALINIRELRYQNRVTLALALGKAY